MSSRFTLSLARRCSNCWSAQLLQAGTRAARPGEFTLRAFLAGKLDLTRAEAVLGVIEADDADELKQALTQLAGGLARPLEGLREDLLNLLADVEAGLDFAEEDLQFVGREALLLRLTRGMAQLTRRRSNWSGVPWPTGRSAWCWPGRPTPARAACSTPWPARPALVSPEPGTTRDYLCRGSISAA